MIDAARENLAWCADNGVHAVVGTTGFAADELDDLSDAGSSASRPTR